MVFPPAMPLLNYWRTEHKNGNDKSRRVTENRTAQPRSECSSYWDPACVNANGRPAIVSVTARAAPPFGCTLRRTVPSPEPLAPCATVTHDALLAAVHVQSVCAVTLITMSSGPRRVVIPGLDRKRTQSVLYAV